MNFGKLQDFLESLVKDGVTPSVDCLIKKDRETIFRYYSGYNDIENKIPINGNEEYLIFSMTKMFTCVCALQLLEKNKYSLDDKIEKYLPEFSSMTVKTNSKLSSQIDIITGKIFGENRKSKKVSVMEAKTPITVRHLFTMGAGFNYDLESPYIKNALENGCNTTRTIVSALSKSPLEFEPGTHFNYSLCHDVLGALIEVWSGKSLGEYLKENILIPLGLSHTYFSKNDNSDNKNLASRYRIIDGKFEKRTLINPYTFADGYESGGAGLISCTEDYSVFLDALANDGVAHNGYRILKKETVDLMKTNQLNEQQYKDFQDIRDGYGYGLGVRTHMFPNVSKSVSPIGEFGWDGAAGAFSMVDTENRISLTYFQHCMSWDKITQHKLRNCFYELF